MSFLLTVVLIQAKSEREREDCSLLSSRVHSLHVESRDSPRPPSSSEQRLPPRTPPWTRSQLVTLRRGRGPPRGGAAPAPADTEAGPREKRRSLGLTAGRAEPGADPRLALLGLVHPTFTIRFTIITASVTMTTPTAIAETTHSLHSGPPQLPAPAGHKSHEIVFPSAAPLFPRTPRTPCPLPPQ